MRANVCLLVGVMLYAAACTKGMIGTRVEDDGADAGLYEEELVDGDDGGLFADVDGADTDEDSAIDGNTTDGSGGDSFHAECVENADCPDQQRPVCWAGICIPSPVDNPDLDAMPSNTWTKIEDIETGGRNSPMLVYAPQLARFVLTGGSPGGHYGNAILHYNTEFFDLGEFNWTNAYPPGAPADYTPESGPTQAPAHDERYSFEDSNGVSRIAIFSNGYGVDSRAYFQYTYLTDEAKLLAFLWNHTVMYDPVARAWTDLGVTPSPTDNDESLSGGTRMMMWGSLGYDPVHREVVLIGGTAPMANGSPGTWVFSLDNRQWRRLQLGSEAINTLRTQAQDAKDETWALISALRNRRYHAEYAQVDLAGMQAQLTASIEDVSDALDAAALSGTEVEQVARALAHVHDALSRLAQVSIQQPVTADTIAGIQEVYDELMWAVYAMDVEPEPRAFSRLAYHAPTRQLILFGGDGLDRQFADTWHYDCDMRTWRKVYPELSPSPRAGHSLVFLPKSGKILLVGGYGLGDGHSYMFGDVYKKIPFETWAYDPETIKWEMIRLGSSDQEHIPGGEIPGPWPAAVNQDDVVLLVPSGRTGRQSWIMKADPTEVDAAAGAENGVGPETIAFRGDEDAPHPGSKSYDPAFYDREQSPDLAATGSLWEGIPTNVWTQVTQTKPVDVRGWGTSTFDSDSRQVLYWGGGHSEYKGTNMFHYSLDTNLWSISSRPEWVLEWTGGFLCPAMLSFQQRPHIPLHGYQTYAYDPPSHTVVAAARGMTFIYDIADRRWDYPPLETPFNVDELHESLVTTPDGVIAWADTGNQDDAGFFRYDGTKHTWQHLEKTGPQIRRPYCDGSGMLYDSTRNSLWLAPGRDLYLYDLDSGQLSQVDTQVPEFLGDYSFWREQAYIPGDDLVLVMRRFDGPDGNKVNVFYDPVQNKWYSAALEFSDGQEHEFSWNSSIFYDPVTGLVFLHNPVSFWVLRFDRQTAGLVEVP